jgi:hypothetical protein
MRVITKYPLFYFLADSRAKKNKKVTQVNQVTSHSIKQFKT